MAEAAGGPAGSSDARSAASTGAPLDAAISELGVRQIDWALFTHHHRDQCFGAADLAADGVKLTVPKFERPHFGQASEYWQQKRIYDIFLK